MNKKVNNYTSKEKEKQMKKPTQTQMIITLYNDYVEKENARLKQEAEDKYEEKYQGDEARVVIQQLNEALDNNDHIVLTKDCNSHDWDKSNEYDACKSDSIHYTLENGWWVWKKDNTEEKGCWTTPQVILVMSLVATSVFFASKLLGVM